MYIKRHSIMKKIGIYYGSATGTTAGIAKKIAELLNVADADLHDVASTSPSTLGDYDVLVLGSSTWGDGELEDDWYDFADGSKALDLKGKKIALFGCGDETMSDTFCDAVGRLYEVYEPTGAKFIGRFNADGYNFEHSLAADGDEMRGLVLDETNRPDLTDKRLQEWTSLILAEA